MKKYIISGIQQIGIGVVNLQEACKWYNVNFGMDCRIFEDDSDAKLMLPYTGGEPRRKHAVLDINLQSGGGFEVWQHTGRQPVPKQEPVQIGDLGIMACKIKARNVRETFDSFRAKGLATGSSLSAAPDGNETFFMTDPYGNIFQIVKANDWFRNENKPTGGTYGAVIGVSDIEKSKVVYSEILGYDSVVYDATGVFADLAGLPGGHKECRRTLLRRSEPFAGPFSKVFGNSEIELISSETPGARIFENRLWGDPGFIHLCFDINGMDEIKSYCEAKGYPFTVDSKHSHEGNSFDMGEAAGHFSYIADPDGVLIEFVETHKIPVLKKLGIYIDLRKRDPKKALPDWMLGVLRFSRVKP
ncbi:MAG: VOC family protein [Bacteroidales bacterium]|jgi:catechol 2,3-dioxygenase-like lactoylglutathione lyase family enzyme|nr:VOC family protein [Bacteroidales bacterium]